MVHTIKTGVFERRHSTGEEAACIGIIPALSASQVEEVHRKVLLPHQNAYIGEAYCRESGRKVTDIHLNMPERYNVRLATNAIAGRVADVIRGADGIVEIDEEAFPYIRESAVELFNAEQAQPIH